MARSTAQHLPVGDNGTVFVLTPHAKGHTAWTKAVLYSFCSQPSCSDGAVPIAGLIADEQGAHYGTTTGGGIGNNGTVFKLTPPAKGQTAWTPTVLYRFCSQPSCSDGSDPLAGLTADERGGALYGTTTGGGSSGVGKVFKLTVVDPAMMRFATRAALADHGPRRCPKWGAGSAFPCP